MLLLRGVVQHYDWGHPTFIPSFLGVPDDGEPWAELWFGTHANGPSDALAGDTWVPLRDVVGDLTILVKILSAERPLSLQTHPSRRDAAAGFARENAASIALDNPTRIYKDANDKPEMLIALTDFSALCGFAPVTTSLKLFATMGWHEEAEVLRLRGIDAYLAWAYAQTSVPDLTRAPDWLRDIAATYPSDKSLRVAPLLNVVHLSPGQALSLPAGNLHAYLCGSAVEVMTSSDNVVRAGFTSKHVDVDELLRVLDTSELGDPVARSTTSPVLGSNGQRFESPSDAFTVDVAQVDGTCELEPFGSSRILVCTNGNVGLLQRGEAAVLLANETVSFSGHGTVYVCAGN